MSYTKGFVVRAAYALAIVIALCITMFGTPAGAQNAPSPRQGQVSLNESLDFARVYGTIVRQVPEEEFETCARWGRDCPPTRRFPSTDGVAPRRLRHFPDIRAEVMGDVLSPGDVAQVLLAAGALSARCYRTELSADGGTRLVAHQVRLRVSTLQARPWDPRHWAHGCAALSLRVRSGRPFAYTVLDTQATETLRDATTDLLHASPSTSPDTIRSAGLQALLTLDEVDPPSTASLLLFVRTLIDKFLAILPTTSASVSSAIARPALVTPPPARRVNSFSDYPRVAIFAWGVLTAVTILSLVLLVVTWRKNERLRKTLLTSVEAEESSRQALKAVQTNLDLLTLESLRLVERLLGRLDEKDERRSRYIDAQGRRHPLIALQDASASFNDLLRAVYAKGAEGEAAKRDLVEEKKETAFRKSVKDEARDVVVEALKRLGCEVKDPQAEISDIVTRVVRQLKDAKTSSIVLQTAEPLPRATLAYSDPPAGTRAGPAPDEIALGQLAGFAAMIIRLNNKEEGNAASPSMNDPRLAAKATAAFEAIQARQQKATAELKAQARAREEAWNEWAHDLHRSFSRLVAFAQDAVALFDPHPGERRNNAADFTEQLRILDKALDEMRDRIFEALNVEADIDSFLPPSQELSETRRDVPVTVKFAALMAYLRASKRAPAPASS